MTAMTAPGAYEARAEEGQCSVESATLNYGSLPSLRSGWQPGVGEVAVRCRNAGSATRTITIAVVLEHDDPLENIADLHAPTLKQRFFEDPGYRMRWGGGGLRQEGRAFRLTIDGMSEKTLRVPVYGMIFVPSDVIAGDYRRTVGISIRYSQ